MSRVEAAAGSTWKSFKSEAEEDLGPGGFLRPPGCGSRIRLQSARRSGAAGRRAQGLHIILRATGIDRHPRAQLEATGCHHVWYDAQAPMEVSRNAVPASGSSSIPPPIPASRRHRRMRAPRRRPAAQRNSRHSSYCRFGFQNGDCGPRGSTLPGLTGKKLPAAPGCGIGR